jgi:hypothetical protein
MNDEEAAPASGRWLLYTLPLAIVLFIGLLTVLYARFAAPHLRPHWLGAPGAS